MTPFYSGIGASAKLRAVHCDRLCRICQVSKDHPSRLLQAAPIWLQIISDGDRYYWLREILGGRLVSSERVDWLAFSSAKVRSMLKWLRATGDRLALIPTLVWLQGGRLALGAESIVLSPDEEPFLGRFACAAPKRPMRSDSRMTASTISRPACPLR